MPKLNFPNRTLAIMDNLKFIKQVNSETIDLIAIDPPFEFTLGASGVWRGGKAADPEDGGRHLHQPAGGLASLRSLARLAFPPTPRGTMLADAPPVKELPS